MIKNSVKYKSFMEVVLERTSRDENNCWNWTGHKFKHGYGGIQWDGKLMLAHRLSYKDFYGEIDENLSLDHLCRNPSCVNPTHLDQVTHKENVLRGVGPTAVNSKKTHCKKGHEFDEINTYKTEDGRSCKICVNIRKRQWRKRQKDKKLCMKT
jgi:hypothetical protein